MIEFKHSLQRYKRRVGTAFCAHHSNRNRNFITSEIDAEFLLNFKACKQAHSKFLRWAEKHCPPCITVLSLLASTLISACSVGPDYQKPVTPAQANFSQAAYAEFSPNGIELSWWKLFRDHQLTELVEQSIQHNYDLKTAQANLQEARALYLQAQLNILPTITPRAGYSDQVRSMGSLNGRSFVPRDLKLFSMGFDATWEMDFFGRVRRGLEASTDEVDILDANLRDLSVSLIAEVARNYFELRGMQNQLAVAQKNIANQTETLSITQAKVENGRGTEQDTVTALAQLEGSKANIPTLQSAVQRTIHRLSVLTGQLPDALTQRLAQVAPLPELPAIIQISTPAELLRRRPDIRIVERTLAASTARIGIATADLFPRVTFIGSIALEGNTLSGIVAPGSDAYSMGPKITWAAFDIGKTLARIKASNAHAEADVNKYQQTVLNALEETENALVTYNQERVRQQLLASAVEASQKARQFAKMRYDIGVTDFQSLLDADARLLQDQDKLSQSQTAVATSLTAIYKALGGGWETALAAKSDH